MSNLFDKDEMNTQCVVINPASGLPMVGCNTGGMDVAGNFYGSDSEHDCNAISDNASDFSQASEMFDNGCDW